MENNIIQMKTSWDEITLNEFIQLDQLIHADIPDSYKTSNIVALLCNKSLDEIENLPITQFKSLVSKLDFIYTKPAYSDVEKSYSLNGHEYKLKAEIPSITTAQYIDYQAYMKEPDKDLTKLISVWLIPAGHEYNDGYDMNTVFEDAGSMTLSDAMGISFFFSRQLAASIKIMQCSLEKNLNLLKKETPSITDQKIKELGDSLNQLGLSLWCIPFAKKS